MEIWQKYKFTQREVKIWELYKAFQQVSRKRGSFRKFLPESTDPRKSKYWKYFEETYRHFEKDPMFDAYSFVKAQFRNFPKGKEMWPAQLKTKAAIERYQEHKEAARMQDENSGTKRKIENLAATFKFLKNWWKRNDLEMDDYKSFFEPKTGEVLSEGMIYCIQNMISKYFIATSKHFNLAYSKLDPDLKWEIITPKELRSYKINLKLDTEAYAFAKELFNGEIE